MGMKREESGQVKNRGRGEEQTDEGELPNE